MQTATTGTFPDDAVESLLATVQPPNNLCDVWAQVLGVEFTQCLVPTVATLPASAPVGQLWKELCDKMCGWLGEAACPGSPR